ncbi:MAG: tandem-95 repeat protein, partial [Planctomycetales bacterium]|nr:tandem-95 repeat protein [Planctomycetales bacterium]
MRGKTNSRLRRNGLRNQVRRNLIEGLEPRVLLAVDTWTINLDGGNGLNLLGSDGGGLVQNQFQNSGSNRELDTSNVPGQNNIPPSSVDDAFSTSEKTDVSGNVLADNGAGADSDADGDALSVSGVAGGSGNLDTAINLPSGANVIMSAGGNFVYSPGNAFSRLNFGVLGTDTFLYELRDARGGVDSGTVTITLTGVNDVPVVIADAVPINEDSGSVDLTSLLLANDQDADLGEASSLIIAGMNTSGSVGILNYSNGSISYDPNGQFESLGVGQTSIEAFEYAVQDINGAISGYLTTSIVVMGQNDLPTATDDSFTTDEDAVATDITSILLGSDNDIDQGDAAQLTVASIDTTGTLGVVTLTNGRVHYFPGPQLQSLAADESLQDIFIYTITDPHGGQATATVTVTVTGVNDAPTTANDSFSVQEDATLAALPNPLANDSDVDNGETLTLQLTAIDTAGTTGVATLIAGVINYDPNGAFDSLPSGQTSTDKFAYTVTDIHGESTTATITLTIHGANDAPTAVNDATSVVESAVTVDLTASVLSNDTDPDTGDAAQFAITAISTIGTTGTVQLNNGVLTYSPNGLFESLPVGQSIIDTFAYTIADPSGVTSTATVTITILGENDQPHTSNDTLSLSEDSSVTDLTTTLLANDTDVDIGENATLVIAAIDTTGTLGTVQLSGGNVTYLAAGNFNFLSTGQTLIDQFNYTVSDVQGSQSTATVSITITGANDAPNADDDQVTVAETATEVNLTAQLLDGDFDADQSETALLTITAINTVSSGTATLANGVVTYTPGSQMSALAVGQTATATFNYVIEDPSGETSQGTVTVTIVGENNVPLALDDHYSILQSSLLSVPAGGLLDNDTDS